MPRYINSTQQKYWVFTKDQLDKIYEDKQAKLFQEILSISNDPSMQRYAATQNEEEIIIFYLSKNLITACKHLHLHDKAISTALTYFKRFYLYHSVCEYDPIQMMFTAIFLSCKTEEINIRDVHNFCQHLTGCDPNAIISLEYELLSGIKFHLYIFCPYKAFNALLNSISANALTVEEKKMYEEKTKEIIESCLISNISFKFSPSEIAMCAFYIALEGNASRDSIYSGIFEGMGKNFAQYRERFDNLMSEYITFKGNSENMDKLFRGAHKKAGSMRHRLKKLQKGEEVVK